MVRSIKATALAPGMVMALPFGRTATVIEASVGNKYVNFTTEHGKSRVMRFDEVLIEEQEDRSCPSPAS
jgi:hypothetical protein